MNAQLENDLQSELDFPRISHRTKNLSGAACWRKAAGGGSGPRDAGNSRRRVQDEREDLLAIFGIRGQVEVRPIQDIEDLCTKLNAAFFVDPKILDDGKIHGLEVWAIDEI